MSWLDMLSRFGSSGAATAAPSGSNIMGYAGMDLSGFSPGGAASPMTNAQMPTGLLGAPGTGASPDIFSMQGAFGGFDGKTGQATGGWVAPLAGIGQALGGMWNAKQQQDLAKDMLKTQKQQFAQNYAAQRQSLNTQMQDRQRARVAANAGAYQSVGDYMNENRIR